MRTIHLPAFVIFSESRLVPFTGDELLRYIKPGLSGRLYITYGTNPRMRITHLFDRCGHLHRLERLSKRRAYLSWFSGLWDFTLAECVVDTVGPMKFGELLVEAKNWKNSDGVKVRKFISKHNPEAVVRENDFKQMWENIYIQLSDDEWQKTFQWRA